MTPPDEAYRGFSPIIPSKSGFSYGNEDFSNFHEVEVFTKLGLNEMHVHDKTIQHNLFLKSTQL